MQDQPGQPIRRGELAAGDLVGREADRQSNGRLAAVEWHAAHAQRVFALLQEERDVTDERNVSDPAVGRCRSERALARGRLSLLVPAGCRGDQQTEHAREKPGAPHVAPVSRALVEPERPRVGALVVIGATLRAWREDAADPSSERIADRPRSYHATSILPIPAGAAVGRAAASRPAASLRPLRVALQDRLADVDRSRQAPLRSG